LLSTSMKRIGVEQAFKKMPPGINLWGKVLEALGNIYLSFIDFPVTSVDLVLGDEEYSLESYGIHGKVIYTPGHSPGSMSLLLDTGDAFVGDLVMNGFPMRISLGKPIFAENANVLQESWRLLLSRGAKQIHPGHGKPFDAGCIRKIIMKSYFSIGRRCGSTRCHFLFVISFNLHQKA